MLSDNADPQSEVLAGTPGVSLWGTGDRSPDKVVAQLANWRPNVVYAHGLEDPGVEAAISGQYPTAFFAHGYLGTCISGTKCFGRRGYQSCTRPLTAACLALYFPRGCGGKNPLTMVRLYKQQRQRRELFKRYAAVLAASRHMVQECQRNGAPKERLHLLPLFPIGLRPAPEPPAPRQRTDRVLFAGRLTALKGLHHLVAAVHIAAKALDRRLTLVVAGEGPERTGAEADARRLGVHVEFLGWVGPERRNAEMRAADVLGMPSLWPEPFGLVGLEAGCMGLPTVGYASGGITDWLAPGVSGECAPGGRPEPSELAAALVRALADEAHHQRLRVGAWQAAKAFSPERHVEELLGVLRAAASGQLSTRGSTRTAVTRQYPL